MQLPEGTRHLFLQMAAQRLWATVISKSSAFGNQVSWLLTSGCLRMELQPGTLAVCGDVRSGRPGGFAAAIVSTDCGTERQ
jgi:hypothetical protein